MYANDPQFKPGEPFHLETMRRVAELAQRAENVSAGGNVGVEVGAGGVRFLDVSPMQRFIRIIAQSPGVGTGVPPTYYYSWEPVRLTGSFSGADYVLDDPPWELDDQAVDVGSYMLFPAIEINQNTAVAMGTVVRAWLGDDGRSMMFDRPSSPTPYSLTVETVDGTPSVTSVVQIEVDEDDGLRLTDLLGGVVRIDIAPASATDTGVVTTGTQTFAGNKTIDGTLDVDGTITVTTGGIVVTDPGQSVSADLCTFNDGVFNDTITLMNGSAEAGSLEGGSYETGYYVNDPTGPDRWGGVVLVADIGSNRVRCVLQGVDASCTDATYSVKHGASTYNGATGTSGGGDTVKGGIITSLGSGTTPADGSITNAKLANMATRTIKARKTGSTGAPEDCTLSEVLDFITSAAQGDILYRDASAWARLAAGTNLQLLRTAGAGANPAWAKPDMRSMTAIVARAFRNSGSGTMTINNGTWTVVTMPNESYDTNSIHDTSSNTSRLTVPSGMDGLWFLWLEINPEYVTLGGYDSEVGIKINGGTLTRAVVSSGVTSTLVYVQTAAAGQYFEPELRQDSGGNYNFPAGGGYLALSAFYLGAV